jgi:hypothetical protein
MSRRGGRRTDVGNWRCRLDGAKLRSGNGVGNDVNDGGVEGSSKDGVFSSMEGRVSTKKRGKGLKMKTDPV